MSAKIDELTASTSFSSQKAHCSRNQPDFVSFDECQSTAVTSTRCWQIAHASWARASAKFAGCCKVPIGSKTALVGIALRTLLGTCELIASE